MLIKNKFLLEIYKKFKSHISSSRITNYLNNHVSRCIIYRKGTLFYEILDKLA